MNRVSTRVEVIFMRTTFLLTFAVLLVACGRVGAQHRAESKSDVITKMVDESKQGQASANCAHESKNLKCGCWERYLGQMCLKFAAAPQLELFL